LGLGSPSLEAKAPLSYSRSIPDFSSTLAFLLGQSLEDMKLCIVYIARNYLTYRVAP